MKKTICSILAVACLAGSIFAQEITPEALAEFEKTLQIDPATNQPYDFEGMEVVIGDWWSDPTAAPKTEREEYQRMYEAWVCETYNVNIAQKKILEWLTAPDQIKDILKTAGAKSENYVLISDTRGIFDNIEAGLVADLSKIKNVNFRDPKFNQAVVDEFKRGKSFYSFNYGPSEVREVVFYNKKLVEAAGFDPDFPYELQKLGKWNWKNFELVCKAVSQADCYGIGGQAASLVTGAVFSNGGVFVSKENNGTFKNQTTSSKTVEAINWIRDINSLYGDPGQGNWDDYQKNFAAGKTAFCVDSLYMNNTYKDMNPNLDIGIIGFPNGPAGGKEITTAFNDAFYIFPAAYDSKRAEKVMKAVDIFFTKNPFDKNYTLLDDSTYSRMDKRAVLETIPTLQFSGSVRYDTIIPNVDINPVIWGIVWKGSNVDAAKAFGEKKAELDKILSEYKLVK